MGREEKENIEERVIEETKNKKETRKDKSLQHYFEIN